MIGSRRRPAGAAGHVPDAGRGLADAAARRLAADRQGLVVRRHGQPDRGAAAARCRRCETPIPTLSTGASVVRYAQDGVLVVSRIDLASGKEIVVGFNNGTAAARVDRRDRDTRRVVEHRLRRPVRQPAALALTIPPVSAVAAVPERLAARNARRHAEADGEARRADVPVPARGARPRRAGDRSRSQRGARAAPGSASPSTTRRRTGPSSSLRDSPSARGWTRSPSPAARTAPLRSRRSCPSLRIPDRP